MTPFMISSINIALPVIGNEYSLNAGTLGWIATSYLLAAQPIMMAAVSPLAGRLSDKIEVRVLASIGMALVALGLALLCFAGIFASMVRGRLHST